MPTLKPILSLALLSGLTACAAVAPSAPPLLLPSQETRIDITANSRNPQMVNDCGEGVARQIQRFRNQTGNSDAYGALYIGYNPEAATCGTHAMAWRAHSTVDASNLAAALCERRNAGMPCEEIALAVPSNHNAYAQTMSQELSSALQAILENGEGFGAVAISATGAYGVVTAQPSPQAAREAALSVCSEDVATGGAATSPGGVTLATLVNSQCRIIANHDDQGQLDKDIVQ